MLAAEAIGTFLLVAVGCTAAAWEATRGGLGAVGVAAVFGLVVALMVWMLGPLSGAHLNPVVTAAFVARREMSIRRAFAFIGVQGSAAVAGAAVVLALVPDGLSATVTHPLPDLPWGSAFLFEVAASALLVFVILAVATEPRVPQAVRALSIGGAVFAGAWLAGPLTGGSMNPARSLGPALVAGDLVDLWLYCLAPAVGSGVAWVMHGLAVRVRPRNPAGPVEAP